MKKVLLGATAALAVSAPAIASAETSGYIDTGYETSDFDYGEFDVLHLGGAIMHEFAGGWAVQADGRTNVQDWDGDDTTYSHGYAAVHAFTSTGNWDWGGWAGLLNYYGSGGMMIGGETRTRFGDFSLQGSIGYADFDQFFDYDAWDVRAAGSFFVSPNFAVNGGVGYTEWDTQFTDYETIDLSLGAAFQFANGVQIYGGYVNTDGDYSTGGGYEGDTLRIGLRYTINGGSLQDFTNDGASWNGAAALHEQFVRW